MEFEWVDAESPDWPPPRRSPPVERGSGQWGSGAGRLIGTGENVVLQGTDILQESAASQERAVLRECAVDRAKRDVERRRRRPSRAAWAEYPLAEARFCVVDLETTGGGPGLDDEIIEIGAVQVNGLELGREFVSLVDPRRPVSCAARAVHGIDDSMLAGAPRLGEALPWLLATVEERLLVFHNAGFDLPFLQRALLESGRDRFEQPVLDTVVLARRLLGGPCALGALTARLGIEVGRLHRAGPDARATALLLVELVGLALRAGAARLGEIVGIRSPRGRPRRRLHPRGDPLLGRLELAIARRERLQVSFHVAAGIEPVEFELVPLALDGVHHLLALDADRRSEVVLEVSRIGRVRGSAARSSVPCQAPRTSC